MDELLRNGSGYIDPTPYQAIKNIEKKPYNKKVKDLVEALHSVAHLAGYDIVGRVYLRDNETGEVYK